VLGNPPFVGAKFMDEAQREDTQLVFAGVENAGLLDFVAAWYVKAAHYMRSVHTGLFEPTPASAGWPAGAHEPSVFKIAPTGQPVLTSGHERANLRCAFVSTNSITQGEQVGVLWGWLLAQGVHIHFAHRTFSWSNEARGKAAVHCVIVGFGLEDRPGKVIYEYDDIRGEPHAVSASNINPYLIDGPDVIAVASMQALAQVPAIANGSIPADGGNLILLPSERDALVAAEPAAQVWIRPYLGAEGFLHNDLRYCLWLPDCPPQTLRALPLVMGRVQAVQAMREQSAKAATRQKAATPTLFTEDRQPRSGRYLAVPRTSSENRRYLPLGYLEANVIAANDLQIVPNATLFHFGVLSSAMHRAWINVTAGRLKSDIRYSVKLTYNTFPWPDLPPGSENNQALAPVHKAQAVIEAAAQAVLDVRAQFQTGTQSASLADLYDPLTMPPALLKAHQKLDAAVDAAYALSGGKKTWKNDAERVAYLFELYQRYTSLLPTDKPKVKRKIKGKP
jgi:hypothetical protein